MPGFGRVRRSRSAPTGPEWRARLDIGGGSGRRPPTAGSARDRCDAHAPTPPESAAGSRPETASRREAAGAASRDRARDRARAGKSEIGRARRPAGRGWAARDDLAVAKGVAARRVGSRPGAAEAEPVALPVARPPGAVAVRRRSGRILARSPAARGRSRQIPRSRWRAARGAVGQRLRPRSSGSPAAARSGARAASPRRSRAPILSRAAPVER